MQYQAIQHQQADKANLASNQTETQTHTHTQTGFIGSMQVRVNGLLRAAASDLDAALAAQPSAEIANRYYSLASHIGSLGDPDSLTLAKEVLLIEFLVSFIIILFI